MMDEAAHFAYAVEAVAPKSPAASDLFMKKSALRSRSLELLQMV